MSNLKGFLSKAKAMSKSALSVVLALCLLMLMIPTVLLVAADDAWDGTTKTPYSGTGSVDDPFVIENGEHLAYMAQQINGGNDTNKHFVLAADIDLNDKAWTPIGSSSKKFTGTFDGQGHTISGLYIDAAATYQGLFGCVNGNTTIKNTKIVDADISAYYYVGGFVGETSGGLSQKLTLTDCSFSGSISALVGETNSADCAGAGGLIGHVSSGDALVENCTVEAGTTINAKRGATLTWGFSGVGGLVGDAQASSAITVTIKNSSSAANITCVQNNGTTKDASGVGGIMGYVRNSVASSTATVKVVMEKCYSTGTISASGIVGGLLGFLRTASATSTGKVAADIDDCYSTANVGTGTGLVGKNYNSNDNLSSITVSINNSYFAGSTTGQPIMRTDGTNGTMNLTVDNVYYLENSATTANSITSAMNGTTISVSNVAQKAAAELASADFVALLNGGRNVWAQGANGPVIARAPRMTNLEVSSNLFTYDPAVTNYTLFLANSVTSLTVTPTVEEGTTLTINGAAATSGAAKAIALTANDTTVITVKIARDGIEVTYTINVTCAQIWDGTSNAAYPNADDADAGSAANPYQISAPEHLAYLAQQVNTGTNYAGKYFVLTSDLDLGDQPWTRIGGNFAGTNRNFNGTFDGNGKTISGLKISEGAVVSVGLFGRTGSGAVIKDLHLEGNITSEGPRVAGFVGEAAGNLTISGCTFTGSVQGQSAISNDDNIGVGGVVGYIWGNHTVKIEDTVLTNANVTVLRGSCGWAVQGGGGMVGLASRGADLFITNSSYEGNLVGENANGGLVGFILDGESGDPTIVNIDHCYTAGTYTLTGTSGGLVGYLRSNKGRTEKAELHINDSYSVAVMNTDKTTVGLVGGNYAWKDAPANCSVEIKNSFFAGTAKYPIVRRGRGSGDGESDPGDMIVTTDNVYYLTGSATTESDLTPKATCEKNATAFADGTVRSLLNGATGDAWGQGATHPTLLPVLKLDDIQLSKGEINFVPLVYDYQVYLSNVIDSIKVTPVTDDASITIKVNGQDAESGVASAAIALADNSTTVITVTIAGSGIEKTYTITVTCVEGWDGASAIPFPNIDQEGAGTAENPFIISVPEHLAFLQKLAASTNVVKDNDTKITTTTVVVEGVTYTVSYPNSYLGNLYGAHFKITADINLNNKPWTFAEFRGRLDGGNHTIKNLNSASGFIAKLAYGSASNLKVVGTVSGGSNVGGVVGQLAGGADLTNCSFSGTVTGTTNVGGLVGSTSPYDGSGAFFDITACSSTGTVTGTGAGIGGLVGNSLVSAQYGGVLNLTDCYSAMTVSTSAASVDNMAGLVGTGNVLYRNCLFVGNVASAYPIGFQASSTVGSVYYKDVSCNTTTSANAGFVGGTKKSAADLNSNALVAVLNTYAAPGVVWAKGAEYPVFTYTDPGDVAAPADPFYMTGLAVEHAVFDFTPSKFTYSLSVPYSADKIHMLPSGPANLTITIDGQTVKTDELSQAISLEVGVEKTVIIKVSLGDSYTNYEVKLTRRAQPADGVWDGALEPFDSKDKKGSTIDNPIIIDTPGKLAYLAAMTNGQDVMLNGKVYKAPMTSAGQLYKNIYFEITADLKMNDVTDYEKWGTKESENGPTIVPANDFTPIGFHSDTATESRSFAGIVNGNEHKIIGLYVSGKNSTGVGGTGLFGCVENGTLRNIHIEKGYVTGGQRVGGLVGRPRSGITAQNCSFSGTVYGTFVHKDHNTMVGGLIGDAVARVILNSCWTEGTVTGGNVLGGLIGQLYMQTGAEIKNCYSVATIVPLQHDDTLCDKYVGGLIGVLSGKAGTVEIYRSHFAGSVPTNTPFIGGKSDTSGAVVAASDTVYYCEGSYVGEVDSTYTYDAVEKSAEEFADGTVTDLLNNLVEYGDYWSWETGDNGYPVSDGVLLVTDYRDHTSDEFYDDGDWYEVFENKPGGTLKDPNSNKGDSDDYDNSDTGETSLFSAALILAMISAISAFLLARRKRSVN